MAEGLHVRQGFSMTVAKARTLAVAGGLYRILAASEQTQGRYTLIDALISPHTGPPLHRHTREDEGFYVLEGELSVTLGDTRRTVGPGSYVHGPAGVAHRFENVTEQVVHMLVLIQPAGLERFFERIGDEVPAGSTTPLPFGAAEIERVLRWAPEFGLEIIPPS